MGNSLLGMLLGLGLLGLAGEASAQECPDRLARLDLLDEAERALVEADLDTTDRKLRELEAALACGTLAERELLGRLWLVEAAWLTMQGDALAAGDSWRAAARVAPGRWVEDFGKQLREAYEAATSEMPIGTATIALDPPLFRWVGAVDGRPMEFPATISPGLHLVQVGSDEYHMKFARMVVAYPSTPIVVQTELVEPTTDFVNNPGPEEGEDPNKKDPKGTRVKKDPLPAASSSLFLAAGANLAVGKEVGPEPLVKVVLPLETGFTIRPGRAWIRAAGIAGPLVGGKFHYNDRYGQTASPVALGGLLAGGASAGQGDMGLMAGFQWPDRIPVRGVVAGRLPRFPAQLEARIGMNAAFERTPEPAFDVVLALTPGLIR